jgi:positive regulator of sigma E activity
MKEWLKGIWEDIKAWFKSLNYEAFLTSKDVIYLFPFVVFVVQLILIRGTWLWDAIVLALYLPILYFGYLKENEDQG